MHSILNWNLLVWNEVPRPEKEGSCGRCYQSCQSKKLVAVTAVSQEILAPCEGHKGGAATQSDSSVC